jgi:hypothetical protein
MDHSLLVLEHAICMLGGREGYDSDTGSKEPSTILCKKTRERKQLPFVAFLRRERFQQGF